MEGLAVGGSKPSKKLKPQRFGRYLLLDRVASGGMAEVWRAKIFGAEDFQRIVAIKKILAHVAEDSDFITMFKDEAKITVLLQHANIGQVYELGKVDDTYYIAMEYVPGKDCKTVWQHQRHRKEPLPIEVACYIIQNVAEGLDYAHRKKDNFGVDLKIVHRDVSPQNILVSWEGEVKVIDFGIAKAAGKASRTQAGILKGKFGYMSPEQVRGLPIDQRADVFAMGICLYELLTGKRAFKAESDFSLLEMVRNVELTPPTLVNKHIPHELEQIIYKSLAKDPDDRYAWASDLSEALQRFLLMNGKPPNRMDVGKYLRENFTVDYDRERLRMEAFREIEMPKEPPKKVEPAPPAELPPELDRGSAAVLAAMREDGGADPAYVDDGGGAFASPSNPGVSPSAPTPPMMHEVSNPAFQAMGSSPNIIGSPNPGTNPGQYTNPGMYSNQVTNPHVQLNDGSNPALLASPGTNPGIRPSLKTGQLPSPLEDEKSPALKYLGIATGALVVTVLIGLGLYFFLVGSGTLMVSSQHSGIKILIDGQPMGEVEGGSLTIPDIKAGVHDIAAQKEGYIPYSGKVTVKKNSTTSHPINLAKLPEQKGKLDIVSKPPGAAIFINGRDTGEVTPGEVEVVANAPLKLELKLDGFFDHSEEVVVKADKTLRKDEITLAPLFVTAIIKSIPDGASVYVNGSRKAAGKTPLTLERLDPEDPPPKLVFKRSGCKSYSTTLGISIDEPKKTVNVRLECR